MKAENAKILWVTWDPVIGSKLEGGLGFKDAGAFNIDMFANQGWHLVNMTHRVCSSLLSLVLKAK